MNKLLKKIAVLTLAGTMTIGMSVNVLAEDPTRDGDSKLTTSMSGTEVTSGITEFYLIKDYDSVNATTSAPNSKSPAETFTYEITPYGVWNAGSTFDAFGTATKITKDNMPMLYTDSTTISAGNPLTVTQNVDKGKASVPDNPESYTGDEKATIQLPTYNTVGDYWYKVEEKKGVAESGSTYNPTTGVFYGTNSLLNDINSSSSTVPENTNGNHTAIYYIHVQVTESDQTVDSEKNSVIVSNVTMHTIAPGISDGNNDNLSKADTDNNGIVSNAEYNAWTANNDNENYNSGKKVNAIENRYYAGDLVVRKEVTGNAGDKDAYYPITVRFTKEAGTVVNSDIIVKGGFRLIGTSYTQTDFTIYGQYLTGTGEEYIKWTKGINNTGEATATCTFYVTDDTTVIFSNIPYGIKYEVTEGDQSADGYTHKFVYTKDTNGLDITTTAETGASFNGKSSLNDEVTAESNTGNATEKWNAAKAAGYITDERDIVTIINEKNSTIDIGVITSNAPYLTMLTFVAAALVLFVRRRKNIFEEY